MNSIGSSDDILLPNCSLTELYVNSLLANNSGNNNKTLPPPSPLEALYMSSGLDLHSAMLQQEEGAEERRVGTLSSKCIRICAATRREHTRRTALYCALIKSLLCCALNVTA